MMQGISKEVGNQEVITQNHTKRNNDITQETGQNLKMGKRDLKKKLGKSFCFKTTSEDLKI